MGVWSGFMKPSRMRKVTVSVIMVTCVLVASSFVYKKDEKRRTIYKHRNEYHQVIHHLFDNRIVENQVADEFIKRFPPTKISAHDNYLTIQYFKNNEETADCCIFYSYYVHIIAKDNRLVKAFATEGFVSNIDFVFFNILGESSEDDYWESRMNNATSSGSS